MSTPDLGPEIPVNGARPAWLRDDELCAAKGQDGDWYKGMSRAIIWVWHNVAAIRLPASHPYYVVQRYNEEHGANFAYWPGGDEAPADWDDGVILKRNCQIGGGHRWTDEASPFDIIGYTKRAEQPADDGEYVRVRRMSLEEWLTLHRESRTCHGSLAWARNVGILPEETTAERFTRETGIEVTPEIERALSWSAGQ